MNQTAPKIIRESQGLPSLTSNMAASSSPTDTPMANTTSTSTETDTTTTTTTTTLPKPPIHPPPTKAQKFHELASSTLKTPSFSYAHLELFSSSSSSSNSSNTTTGIEELDALQVKSYCTAALKQFLGVAGLSIPLDILKTQGRSCWVRVPREDLGAFAAAVTAWQGVSLDDEGGGGGPQMATLRIRGCSDWLGALVGGRGEERLWTG